MIVNGIEIPMNANFNFWCPNSSNNPSCKYCGGKGELVISLEEGPGIFGFPKEEVRDSFTCPDNKEEKVKFMGRKMGNAKFQPMTQEQIKSDRLSRSREHFKKEIFPTLDTDSQRHHVLKNPKLKSSVDISVPKVTEGARKTIEKAVKKNK